MEHDLKLIISSLYSKVEKLIQLHTKLEEENSRLEEENRGLKTSIVEQQDKIRELETRYRTLKIVKSMPEGEGGEMKQKINEMIKEIDQCISLVMRQA